MRVAPTLVFFALAAVLVAPARAADDRALERQQALAARPAVKINVRENGWYRVGRAQLLAAGLPRGVRLATLRLFVGGAEVPIRVRRNGAIEFFGARAETPTTDTRVYWLAWGDEAGRRISLAQRGRLRGPVAQSFASTVLHRPRTQYFAFLVNGPAENFFGALIRDQPTSLKVITPAVHRGGGNAAVEVKVRGLSLRPHVVKVVLNGHLLGSISFANWEEGVLRVNVPVSQLEDGENTVTFSTSGQLDVVLPERIRVTYARLYRAVGDRLSFRLAARRRAQVVGFSTPDLRVVNTTQPGAPKLVPVAVRRAADGYVAVVGASAKTRRLFAFTDAQVQSPAAVVREQPSSWHRVRGADVVMISYRDFIPALAPLRELRERQGLSVAVVDVEDLYDEFSFGLHGPDAIKDFLRQAAATWRPAPRFALLVGDSSIDPRRYLGEGQDYVPLRQIQTPRSEVISDDWFVDFDDDGVPELAVGRIAAMTAAETATVVGKIVDYESQPSEQRPALFVSDEDPSIDLVAMSEALRTLIPAALSTQTAYRRESVSRAAFRQRLFEALNTGPSIVDYTGHGGPEVLGRDSFFVPSDIQGLSNGRRLSLWLMTTCLAGYFGHATRDGIAEDLLEEPDGGAIGVWSAAGAEDAGLGHELNQAALSTIRSSPNLRLGEVIVAAKRAVSDSDAKRTMILFGDPATVLRY